MSIIISIAAIEEPRHRWQHPSRVLSSPVKKNSVNTADELSENVFMFALAAAIVLYVEIK